MYGSLAPSATVADRFAPSDDAHDFFSGETGVGAASGARRSAAHEIDIRTRVKSGLAHAQKMRARGGRDFEAREHARGRYSRGECVDLQRSRLQRELSNWAKRIFLPYTL